MGTSKGHWLLAGAAGPLGNNRIDDPDGPQAPCPAWPRSAAPAALHAPRSPPLPPSAPGGAGLTQLLQRLLVLQAAALVDDALPCGWRVTRQALQARLELAHRHLGARKVPGGQAVVRVGRPPFQAGG